MKKQILILRRLLSLLIVSSACLSSVNAAAKFKRETFQVNGRACFLILPEKDKLKAGVEGKVPWVFYAPTFENSLPSDTDEGWMIQRLLDQGIAIAGIDVGESYGSRDGQKWYGSFYNTVVEKYRFDTKASLLARSRGGLMLYAWAIVNPEKVKCIAGIYPVCDLESYPGLAKACGAYKLTEGQLKEQLEQHNIIPRLEGLAKAKVPIFHIHGDVDDVVPLDANSQALAKRYRELGGEIEVIISKGQGHNMWAGFFECQELVDFLIMQATGRP